ncbi:MAG: elongation factor 4 [Candidatus Colwellbacteria bacterium]|nr:elongation factor 4 [Candidatus Colwellbacteria bacterium]
MEIRNFVIIAHIDHGKSTLADRLLELTNTVPSYKMKAQYLDQMELERERGITIKMAPVRMAWRGVTLNLIDTPGHSDFSYEVSRALKAVEGAVLLVDATQGIQAQTLANFENARKAKLVVIGVLNKIDVASSEQLETSAKNLAGLLGIEQKEILRVSGRTGEGVVELLETVIERVPPPKHISEPAALVFSSLYDEHRGVIAFVRVFGGEFLPGRDSRLVGTETAFKVKEVGLFKPDLQKEEILKSGDIGYIATGIKNPDSVKVGDTIGEKAMEGFEVPRPVVFVSLYPDNSDSYDDLKTGLRKLRLNDSSFSMSPTVSEALGRGFQCGFLGRLHFEIIVQRLEREFGLGIVNSFPSVSYKVTLIDGKRVTIDSPKDFPDEYSDSMEPIALITILSPVKELGAILKLKDLFKLENVKTEFSGDNVIVSASLPLADLISDFDDCLKSASSGFASFSYEISGYDKARVKRLDVVIAGVTIPGLSRIIHESDVDSVARKTVEKLKKLLPRQQFSQAIQAVAGGRIVARETIPALKKDVTGYLYGGDRSRKMKLWKKQKEGKTKLLGRARAEVPAEVFKELLKK